MSINKKLSITGERLRFAAQVGTAIANKTGTRQYLMVWKTPDGKVEWRFQSDETLLFAGDQMTGFMCQPKGYEQ